MVNNKHNKWVTTVSVHWATSSWMYDAFSTNVQRTVASETTTSNLTSATTVTQNDENRATGAVQIKPTQACNVRVDNKVQIYNTMVKWYMYSSSQETHLRAAKCHPPYVITVLPATRHRWTPPPQPQPDRPVLDLPNPAG